MVDNKLQDRPPSHASAPGPYEYGPQPCCPQPGSVANPSPAPPPPYPYPAGQGYPSAQMNPAIAQQPYPGTNTISQPSVVVVGGCPACGVGVLEDNFTCMGILCCICFFPLGLLCLFAMRQRRCRNCGASFG